MAGHTCALAEDTVTESETDISPVKDLGTEYYVNAEDFGANGQDEEGNDNAALNKALKSVTGTEDKPLHVYVPAGTYLLADSLNIYSNTILELDDDAVISMVNGDNVLVHGVHLDDDGSRCWGITCDKKGYTQLSNITIKGGTWEQNADTAGSHTCQLITLRHGKNITIEDAVFQNGTNHMVNLSGCNYITINNCTFRNAIQYSGSETEFWGKLKNNKDLRLYSVEALHLDSMTEENEPGLTPADGTNCSNVTVTNCTFDHVFAGLGTHHTNGLGTQGQNWVIQNNTFNEIMGFCIDACGVNGLTVSNTGINNVNQCGGLICMKNATNAKVSGFSLVNTKYNLKTGNSSFGAAIRIEDNSNVSLKNITLTTDIPTNAIGIKNSTAVLDGISVTKSKKSCFYAVGAKFTLKNSTLQNASGNLFYLESLKSGSSITKCTIQNTPQCGIYVNKCTYGLKITYNTITGAKKMAVYVTGTAAAKSKATVTNNVLKTTKGNYDVYLAKYSKGSIVKNNIIGKRAGAVAASCGKVSSNTVMTCTASSITSCKCNTAQTLSLKWKKVSCNGYQIMYATSKSFADAKTVSVGSSTVSKNITGLKSGSTCYVKIRTFKKKYGMCDYSSWSSAKSVKIK